MDTVLFIAPYFVERRYGGPEEGGWWYDAGAPAAGNGLPVPVVATSEEVARQAAASMQAALDQRNQDEGNRPKHSVLSTGMWEVHVTDTYPAPFPSARPHYE